MTTSRSRPFAPSPLPTILKQSTSYCLAFGLMVASAFAFVSQVEAKTPVQPTQLVKLNANEKLAHKVVSGELGPFKSAQVWLTQSDSVDDAPYAGKVAVRGTSGAVQTFDLPRPDETEASFMMKVRAVIFRNVDGGAGRELVVLHSSTRIGPQQPVEYGACVYHWNGKGFIRLAEVEQRLAGARTVADVNARLAAAGKPGAKQ